MKEIELLEMEIKLMQENIVRLKAYIKEHKDDKWIPYSSNVFGELKHRGIVMKQRLTQVSKLSTRDLFNKK